MNATEARTAAARALADIAPEVDAESLDGTLRLRQDLDLDSLDFLNLVQALQQTTGVDIPEADYPLVETFDGLVGYLVTRSERTGAA